MTNQIDINNKTDSGITIWTILLSMFNNHNNLFDNTEIIDAIKDEYKEKWKEKAVESINNIINNYNITDKEQINNLYKMYSLQR